MTVEPIFNAIPVNERIVTAGQPTAAQLRAAREDGLQVVINLAPGIGPKALPSEAELVQALGMEYVHIPVAWDAPRLEDFEAFTEAMTQGADKTILIHCVANARVTAFFSSYAMKALGWSEEQADAFMARIWGPNATVPQNEIWRAFVAQIRA